MLRLCEATLSPETADSDRCGHLFRLQVGHRSVFMACPLGKHARKPLRQYSLEGHQASEEFFKLNLDMGLSLLVALSIMKSVKQAR